MGVYLWDECTAGDDGAGSRESEGAMAGENQPGERHPPRKSMSKTTIRVNKTMTLNEYQEEAEVTAVYPEERNIIYPTLGLTGEAGEVADKVKKVMRDKEWAFDDQTKIDIALELGDVLWYVSILARDLGMSLENIAEMNIGKLRSRQARGMLGGSGDHR